MLSSVVSSQADLHARYGGVVPEIASRRHLELVSPVVRESLAGAGATLDDVESVAVTQGPGLVGALLVGISVGKAIAWARRSRSSPSTTSRATSRRSTSGDDPLEPPFVCLLASGGHTLLLAVRERGSSERLGTTLDDAAGEAFDKGARLLGLGYPGGAAIDALAQDGDPGAFDVPGGARPRSRLLVLRAEDGAPVHGARPRRGRGSRGGGPTSRPRTSTRSCARSRSGRGRRRRRPASGRSRSSAASRRTPRCARRCPTPRFAPLAYCTDNAAMIASAARFTPADPVSRLPRARRVCLALVASGCGCSAPSRWPRSSPRGRGGAGAVGVVARRGGLAGRPRRPRLRSRPRSGTSSCSTSRRSRSASETRAGLRPRRSMRALDRRRDRAPGAVPGAAGRRGCARLARVPLRPRAERVLGPPRPDLARPSRRATPRSRACTRSASPIPRRPADAQGVAPSAVEGLEVPGLDGSGVTVALLDTGVDPSHPYLRGSVLPGVDVIDPGSGAVSQPHPTIPGRPERHGTELAGIITGDDGPDGLHGVAPGAIDPPGPRRRLAAGLRGRLHRVLPHRSGARRPRGRSRSEHGRRHAATPLASR